MGKNKTSRQAQKAQAKALEKGMRLPFKILLTVMTIAFIGIIFTIFRPIGKTEAVKQETDSRGFTYVVEGKPTATFAPIAANQPKIISEEELLAKIEVLKQQQSTR
jgi:hypothetical protein